MVKINEKKYFFVWLFLNNDRMIDMLLCSKLKICDFMAKGTKDVILHESCNEFGFFVRGKELGSKK